MADAILYYGTEKQLRKLQEEAGELIAAVSQYLDNRGKGLEKLHEEFVDVEMVMKQIRLTLDDDTYDKYRSEKFTRLEKRLKEDKPVIKLK